jgi:hypothetical protein
VYNITGENMANNYINTNRKNLLFLYGMTYAAKELDLALGFISSSNKLRQEASLDAVVTHKYNGGTIEYPIKYPASITNQDAEDARDLCSIAMCEEAVCSGFLVRKERKYLQKKSFDISSIPNYNKYIIQDKI